MIIPYGHSGLRITGPPWASIALFVLCVLVYGVTSGPSHRAAATSAGLLQQIVEGFTSNPKLELDPEILEIVYRRHGVDENEREVFLEALADHAARNPHPADTVTQEELDRLTERFWAAYRSAPSYRLGVLPNAISGVDLITYQFMHGSWGHLFGNLLILFLAAPYIEQRWGRVVFVGFYLAAGIVSALFWAFRYPDLDVPLVGASGSIAGLMGAFLICFGSSKIRFLYIGGTFEAPAWLMLPIWLAMEVISGRSMDVMSQGGGGGGVAHWAHVWGFIFGMAFAWALGLTGLEQRVRTRRGPEALQVAHRRAPATVTRTPLPPAGPSAEAGPTVPPAADPSPPASTPEPATIEPDRSPIDVVGVEDDGRPTVEIRPAERLKVLEGVPRSLDGPVLRFAAGDAARSLRLDRVEAIAVGAIAQPGGRPFVVVDLLLDPPWNGDGDLRSLRLRSSSFDPRRIVGGDQAMEAFTRLLSDLLGSSSAVPLPDADHLRSPGSTTYGSVEEYQGRVLGVV